MSTKLNKNQLLAIPMVANGMSGKAVAKELKVTEETISRWKKIPEFQASVNAILKDAMDSARERLRGLISKALDTLEDAINGDEISQKDKANIAFKILALCNAGTLASEKIGSDDPNRVAKKQAFDGMIEIY